eukprot:760540-Heterocapsa_arctica.AAC.1
MHWNRQLRSSSTSGSPRRRSSSHYEDTPRSSEGQPRATSGGQLRRLERPPQRHWMVSTRSTTPCWTTRP